MSSAILYELPYHKHSHELFSRIRQRDYAVWLDSCFPDGYKGRFDIMSADPIQVLQGEDTQVLVTLRQAMRDYFGHAHSPDPDLPFIGGAMGFLSYDLSDADIPEQNNQQRHFGFPKSCIGIYAWSVIQDHRRRRCLLVCSPKMSETQRQDLRQLFMSPDPHDKEVVNPILGKTFAKTIDAERYRRDFEQIQAYIMAGDCYQVNYTQHFSAPFHGDPWPAYQALRREAKAPFSAYFSTPAGTVLSVSPERFIKVHGRHVETKPIKGTQPRHSDPFIDAEHAKALCNSEKDMSENLMIVDLMRNDIGRHSVPGSVVVDKLFELESYSNVHHLVSTISSELTPGSDALDILKSCFPGGSITGAPKRRAMEIIKELEATERSVYCGSMFYLSADGNMDSSICIRTFLVTNNQIHCWGGGGLVADSLWNSEYNESVQKVERFMSTLEQKFLSKP
ncbi:MAG TPA: aminodeoxychorismate synthase component I [Pseudomonadales bacterium]|nr:aminodeoxychorismate synthase component I [Pseudomonadales bacterium]